MNDSTRLPQSTGPAPTCPYCNAQSKLVGGFEIYPHRFDLRERYFWQCAPCGAFVGCHPGTTNALGTPANAELRRYRSAAHAAFDPIWRYGYLPDRTAAYRWLADALGIPAAECHIGQFDGARCAAVVELCNAAIAQHLAQVAAGNSPL